MNNHVRNRGEHSNLCLIAVYAIHVVFFHVLTPARLSVSKAMLPSEFDLLLSERSTRNIARDNVQNVSSLIVDAADVDVKNVEISFERTRDRNVNAKGSAQYSYQVSLQGWNCSNSGRSSIIHEKWILTTVHCLYQSNASRLTNSTIKVDLLLNTTSSSSQINNVSQTVKHKDDNEEKIENDIVLLLLTSYVSNDPIISTESLQTKDIVKKIECYIANWNSPLSDNSVTGIVCKNTLTGMIYQECTDIHLDILCRTWIEKKVKESTLRTTTEESLNSTWGIFFGCLAFLLTFTKGQGTRCE